MSREPIRVLHVVTYMGRGGLETMLMNYYRHMDRSKVQFDFLVHREFEADYDPEIISLGGRIFRLPRLVPWSANYQNAINIFFDNHPEYKIVHAHQDCLSSVVLKVAKKHNVPVRIAHSHNSNQDKNIKYLIKLFYKRQIPDNATQLFACGKAAGDWMFRDAPYSIVNNAIDPTQYLFNPDRRRQMRRKLGISEGTFVVGHIGRFDPQKNHSFLLDIFGAVNAQNSNSLLLLVGDGDLRTTAEKKAAALGISDRVFFTGVRSDVPELMQAMDCFVFPSLYEGLPLTLVEAQAAGLPCIVSDAVPAECAKTDLIEYLSLSKTANEWANQILKHTSDLRRDTCTEIAQAGYDIVANAQWLQNYYLEQWKKEA